ncbi:imelysin family protein [Oceaniglobus roseus]|uniref:imelysin family protein n=1 Tax=Oceaniglobus roseus TaxID=1737570 RepID=UPI000C7EAAF5|nr:imelysin family protein [Kandeliimicrobium roseum]
MKHLAAALVLCCATPAVAGVDEVIDTHILPGMDAFAEASAKLSDTAASDCTAEAVRPAYQSAFDAWMGVSHLTIGPLEQGGRLLAIAFWPDAKGAGARTLGQMIATEDPAVDSPEAFADVSVAARGFFALDRLLYEDPYEAGSYTCKLVQAVAADLSRMAGEVDAEWHDSFAETLRTAGEPGNDRFLTRDEAVQALFTLLGTGLEVDHSQRLGRPMGTFERPRPERAEARRSGRSLRNVVLSLQALRRMADALADQPIPQTDEAFANALDAADFDDPVFAGAADPMGRFKLEALQQAIDTASRAVDGELGAQLGVTAGFNSLDGD